MKHLKKYRIFESKFDELMDHIKVLSDMALSLDDKDFYVSIFEDRFREDSYHSYIIVDVVKKNSNLLYGRNSRSDNNKFTFQAIKEELMEMVLLRTWPSGRMTVRFGEGADDVMARVCLANC